MLLIFWLELFEKSNNSQNLNENQILETWFKMTFKSTWCPEGILFIKKIWFISKITKLDSNVKTVETSRRQNLRHFFYILVVSQEYSTRANDVYVIIGNSALVKCEIPSFVADFVSVHSWVTNQGDEYFSRNSGTKHFWILFLNGTHKFKNCLVYHRIIWFFFQLFHKGTKQVVMKSTSFWEIQHYSNVKFQVL